MPTTNSTPAVPTVVIDDHDGSILPSDIINGTVTAKVHVDPSIKSASVIVTINGTPVTLTLSSDGSVSSSNGNLASGGYYNGVISLTIAPPGDGKSLRIQATQTDQQNNVSAQGEDSSVERLHSIDAPTVVIHDHSGSILASDITNGMVTAVVNVDPTCKSASILVTLNGKPVTLDLHSDGSVSSSNSALATGGYINGVVSLTMVAPGDGKALVISATQISQSDIVSAKGEDHAIEHLTENRAPTVTIDDHDGSLLVDNITNGTVTAKVLVNPTCKSVNITVTVDGTPVTLTLHSDGTVISDNTNLASGGYYNGVISLTIAAPGDGKTLQISATQTDQNDNVSDIGLDSSVEHLSVPPPLNPVVNGIEDTPLTLTWAEFHIAEIINGFNLGITINNLPANGMLLLNGTAVTAGQIINKSDIDAGHLVFKPALNESGEDQYNVPGVGNKHNDYAHFDYTSINATNRIDTASTFVIDIAPVADAPIGVTQVGPVDTILEAFTRSIDDGTQHYKTYSLTWSNVNLRQPSLDRDGSEYHIARISVVDTLNGAEQSIDYVSNFYKILALPNNHYLTTETLSNPDLNAYYDAETKEFVINTDVYSLVYWGQLHASYFDGNRDITVNYGSNISIENIAWEVNSHGDILNSSVSKDAFYIDSNVLFHSAPLILDLNGDNVHTLPLSQGVAFDLSNQGSKIKTGWVDSHDGLLALDLNHDGQINNGSELFDQVTQLPDGSVSENGYAALAKYDTNHDGRIDQQDTIFSQLSVWVDANSDGITQSGELKTLGQAGVTAVNLNGNNNGFIDANGNNHAITGTYTGTDNLEHAVAEVWFYNEGDTVSGTAHAGTPPVTPVLKSALSNYLDTQQSLDSLLENAGLNAATAVTTSKSTITSKVADSFVETKYIDMAQYSVTSHELMA